jgi:putative hydrolase of the HAD superfamily
MQFQTIVFDLDETLYPSSCGLMTAVAERIHTYFEKVTGLVNQEALLLRKQYLATYGTTLRGLQLHYPVEVEDYLAFVHQVPASRFVQPATALDALLARLPQQKIIFTNGTREHAANVLQALAIEHHFTAVLDIRDYGYEPKPAAAAYKVLLRHLSHGPRATLYLDDRLDNLIPAAKLGITTVLITENGHRTGEADHHIHDLMELEGLLTTVNRRVNGHGQAPEASLPPSTSRRLPSARHA